MALLFGSMAYDAADREMQAKGEGCLFGAAVGDPSKPCWPTKSRAAFPKEGLADYVSVGKQRGKEQKGLCVVRVDAGGPCALILALESLDRHLLARSMLCLAGGVRVDAGRDLEARQRSK